MRAKDRDVAKLQRRRKKKRTECLSVCASVYYYIGQRHWTRERKFHFRTLFMLSVARNCPELTSEMCATPALRRVYRTRSPCIYVYVCVVEIAKPKRDERHWFPRLEIVIGSLLRHCYSPTINDRYILYTSPSQSILYLPFSTREFFESFTNTCLSNAYIYRNCAYIIEVYGVATARIRVDIR